MDDRARWELSWRGRAVCDRDLISVYAIIERDVDDRDRECAVAPRDWDGVRDANVGRVRSLGGVPALLGEKAPPVVGGECESGSRCAGRICRPFYIVAFALAHVSCAWYGSRGPLVFLRLLRAEQPEPEKVVRAEGEEIRQLADRRKAVLAPELERQQTGELAQVQLHVLRKA